jgi:hypothetical protein
MHCALRLAQQARDDAQERGFANAIVSGDEQRIATAKLRAHRAQNPARTVCLAYTVDLEVDAIGGHSAAF